MLTPNLSAIIHAGRSALRRAGSDARLRDVACAYALAVLQQEPEHHDAAMLYIDADGVTEEEAGARSA